MKATIECGRLKKIIGMVKPLDRELSIECKNTNWSIRCVDPAHVAMIDVAISKEYFSSYQSDGEECVRVPLEKVKNFCQLVKTSDVVEIETKDGKLVLSDGFLTRKINLLDNCGDSVRVPKLELPVSFELPTAQLSMAAKAGSSVSDHIEINVKDGKVTFLSAGDTDEIELSSIVKCKENAKSLFPLDYFTSLVKAIPSSDCTIRLGDDMPLILSFSDGEAAELVGDMLIAPRIEEVD